MDIHLNGIRSDRLCRCGDECVSEGQSAGTRERARRVADCEVGNAAAGVTVPAPGADISRRRQVDELIVSRAVGVIRDAYRLALTRLAGRGCDLPRLPKGQGNTRCPWLQVDRKELCVLQSESETVAIVAGRIARASGDGNSRRYGEKQQKNKR